MTPTIPLSMPDQNPKKKGLDAVKKPARSKKTAETEVTKTSAAGKYKSGKALAVRRNRFGRLRSLLATVITGGGLIWLLINLGIIYQTVRLPVVTNPEIKLPTVDEEVLTNVRDRENKQQSVDFTLAPVGNRPNPFSGELAPVAPAETAPAQTAPTSVPAASSPTNENNEEPSGDEAPSTDINDL